MEKKLYKSNGDKKIDGVCGGIARYCKVDSTVIRLAWVLISLFTGCAAGVVAYAICCIIIPAEPTNIIEEATSETKGV